MTYGHADQLVPRRKTFHEREGLDAMEKSRLEAFSDDVIWINHHATSRRLRNVDRSILILNIALLMTIVVLPFTTALMSRYLLEDSGRTLAAVVYVGSLLLMSLLFLTLNWHLLSHHTHLLREEVTPAYRRTVLRRNMIGV